MKFVGTLSEGYPSELLQNYTIFEVLFCSFGVEFELRGWCYCSVVPNASYDVKSANCCDCLTIWKFGT